MRLSQYERMMAADGEKFTGGKGRFRGRVYIGMHTLFQGNFNNLQAFQPCSLISHLPHTNFSPPASPRSHAKRGCRAQLHRPAAQLLVRGQRGAGASCTPREEL